MIYNYKTNIIYTIISLYIATCTIEPSRYEYYATDIVYIDLKNRPALCPHNNKHCQAVIYSYTNKYLLVLSSGGSTIWRHVRSAPPFQNVKGGHLRHGGGHKMMGAAFSRGIIIWSDNMCIYVHSEFLECTFYAWKSTNKIGFLFLFMSGTLSVVLCQSIQPEI